MFFIHFVNEADSDVDEDMPTILPIWQAFRNIKHGAKAVPFSEIPHCKSCEPR